ncbi:uncharacterized protein M437DRAFT_65350 [Aureobasidium melanogenum CBS 110374]|uniref:Uncharacterized protein n=1 Tax=Aureobasidium melanogenum (strain CBS 110374) TaxID=1043003 RepID=A0A074VRI7_AURM1|nr:uncharacterized protein M437DRAFT_65350 [Aureobasidium melanogenum CBS 110374]KEQ63365.1 hypothetical protein M437DRAFT_65350 [Aureobasidium melanogenum CBS 110374]
MLDLRGDPYANLIAKIIRICKTCAIFRERMMLQESSQAQNGRSSAARDIPTRPKDERCPIDTCPSISDGNKSDNGGAQLCSAQKDHSVLLGHEPKGPHDALDVELSGLP